MEIKRREGRSEALIANVAELVQQHLSGSGGVPACGCVLHTVGVGKRDVLNERAAGRHTHTHTKHPLSVLLSHLILLLAAFCLCLFSTNPLNLPLC